MDLTLPQSDSSSVSHGSSSNTTNNNINNGSSSTNNHTHTHNLHSLARPTLPTAVTSRRDSLDRSRPSLSGEVPALTVGQSSSTATSPNPALSSATASSTTPSSTHLPTPTTASFPYISNPSSAASRSANYFPHTSPNVAAAGPAAHKSSPSIPGGMSSFNSAGTVAAPPSVDAVPTTFDEATLRALCDTDVGLPLLYERIKQSMTSCREAASFFKKRGTAEEEYGRALQKNYKASLESYGSADGKAGTYVTSWHTILVTHEHLADSRIKFGQRLLEMSEELGNLVKEIDRNRKSARETGQRLEKGLLDAESSVEKARARFESAAEELERVLLLKSGESGRGGELAAQHASGSSVGQAAASKGRSLGKAMSKGGMLFNKKNPQQLLRQEDELRTRTSQLSDTFRREVLQTQQMRQEYFNLQLPRILRSLKETAEEIDNGLQYHLSRYAFLYESTILGDGMTVTPVGASAAPISEGGSGQTGLRHAAETIDNRTDFKTYMQNYQIAHARDYRGPKREGPYEDGYLPGGPNGGNGSLGPSSMMSSSASTYHLHNGGSARGVGQQPSSSSISGASNPTTLGSSRPIFGVDLDIQMARDNVDVPGILEKCAHAVETFGKENMGIYRLSGTTSKVQRLKAKFDADWTAVDLFEDAEALSDINIVSGCLKLWFRELPEPLLTWELYRSFIDAAKVDNDRLRHIRLHEIVNQLPDANYSTLKALMGHLDRIRSEESVNQMGASNLAIVFGPTLLGPPPPGHLTAEGNADGLEGNASLSMSGLGIDSIDDPSSTVAVASTATTGAGVGGTGGAGGGAGAGSGAGGSGSGSSALADMQYQAKAIETILVHYRDIFLEDDEIEEEERARAIAREQQEAVLMLHSS